jgi:molybdopterin-guanine dinucleotide biosynthesis protein A
MEKELFSVNCVTGIILAGGKSSRFGSDKSLFEFNGKKLIEYSIATLQPLCGQILLSTNEPEKYAFTGLSAVSDTFPGCGPVAGIHACIEQSKTEHHLVIGCDLPWLDTRLFEFILQNSFGHQVVMPMHKGFKETMASYYHESCSLALAKALVEKRYKIFDAIAPLKTFYPEIDKEEFYSEKLFANINYRDDIE